MDKNILEVLAYQQNMMINMIELKNAIEGIESKTDIKATEVYMCLGMLTDALIRMTMEVSNKLLIKADVDNLLLDLKKQIPPESGVDE